jgi:RNA polymerase sigma-70 factor, ECF subfamily
LLGDIGCASGCSSILVSCHGSVDNGAGPMAFGRDPNEDRGVSGDDRELMQRVQQGEFGCFDILVERYRSALLRVASGMLYDQALAEDVVQETFLAVFAARHTFNPAFHFRTWLWTILLNFCRRHRARQARRPQQLVHSSLAPGEAPQPVEAATPETALAGLLERERGEQLQRLLDELPDVQADAIRLRFFAGLTYHEIGQSMGISVGGAKLRVRTGLAKLSRQLRGDKESRHEL